MGVYHYEIPPLPPEPLWIVPVQPVAGFRDGEFRVRAPTAEKAAERARALMGLTPVEPAERVEEGE